MPSLRPYLIITTGIFIIGFCVLFEVVAAIILEDIRPYSSKYEYDLIWNLASSALLTLAAFIACFAGCFRNKLFTKICAWFVPIAAGLMLGNLILLSVMNTKLSDHLEDGLKTLIKAYAKSSAAKKTMDDLQKGNKCCGAQSSKDWKHGEKIPDSCYAGGTPEGQLFTRGCLELLTEKFSNVTMLPVFIFLPCLFGFIQAYVLGFYKKYPTGNINVE